MQADLVKQLTAIIGKPKIVSLSKLLVKNNTPHSQVIDVTFHPDEGVAFRAAWLLENMYFENPEGFLPHIPYFISKFKAVSNAGCKRHYAKILMHLTEPQAPLVVQQYMQQIDLEQAVEQCFDWLIDPKIKVAVKAFAAEALFNMRHRYPWIADELPEQLEFLMRNGSAAIQAKGKRLLNQPDQ